VDGLADATITEVYKKKKLTGGGKTRVITDEVTELDAMINDVFGNLFEVAADATQALGLELGSYNVQITESIKGLEGAELDAKIAEIIGSAADQFVQQSVPIGNALTNLRLEGENLVQTLARVTRNTLTVNDALRSIGQRDLSFAQVDDLLQRTSVDAINAFFDTFATDADKFTRLEDQVTRLFEGMDLAVPRTRQELLSLVRGLDLWTEAGQEALATLTNNTAALASYYSEIEKGAATLANSQRTARLDAERSAQQALLTRTLDTAADSDRIKASFEAAVKSSAAIANLMARGFEDGSVLQQQARAAILVGVRQREDDAQITAQFFAAALGPVAQSLADAVQRIALSGDVSVAGRDSANQITALMTALRTARGELSGNALRVADVGTALTQAEAELQRQSAKLSQVLQDQLLRSVAGTSVELQGLGRVVSVLASTAALTQGRLSGNRGLAGLRDIRAAQSAPGLSNEQINNAQLLIRELSDLSRVAASGAGDTQLLNTRLDFIRDSVQALTGVSVQAGDGIAELTQRLRDDLDARYTVDAILARDRDAAAQQIQDSNTLMRAGLGALSIYFAQLGEINAELTDAAEQAEPAIAAMDASIGRLRSFATVFGESAQAVLDGAGDIAKLQGPVTPRTERALLNAPEHGSSEAERYAAAVAIANAANRLADIATTREAAAVADALRSSEAFADVADTTLKDISRLVESVAAFDAPGLERAFVRASDALAGGTITLEQYTALIDYSQSVYQGASAALNTLTDSAQDVEAIARERYQLETQLLQLQGNTTELRARERAELFESNRDLYDRITALQDEQAALDAAARASEESARAAEQAARDAEQAERELRETRERAVSDALEAVKRAVDAQKAQIQSAADAQIEALEAQAETARESARVQIDAARQTVDGLRGLFSTLDSALESATVRTAGSTRALQAQAQSTLRAALEQSRTGASIVDFPGLEAAIEAASNPSADSYGSFDEFLRGQDESADLIRQLRDQTQDRLSVADLTLAAIESAAEEADRSARRQIDAVREQAQAQLAALDAVVEQGQRQVDAVLGLDTSTKSVADAVTALNTSIASLAEFARQAAAEAASAAQSAASTAASIAAGEARAAAAATAAASAAAAATAPAAAAAASAAVAGAVQSFATLEAASAAYNAPGGANTRIEVNPSTGRVELIPLATGTNYVPRDMPAWLHEGEAVVPRRFNPAAGGAPPQVMVAMERTLATLTAEVERLRAAGEATERNTRRTAGALNDATQGGAPIIVRMEVA
ncbi:MAG: hypothetical protein ACT4PG_02790, partial [Panacagrimonas sp.]